MSYKTLYKNVKLDKMRSIQFDLSPFIWIIAHETSWNISSQNLEHKITLQDNHQFYTNECARNEQEYIETISMRIVKAKTNTRTQFFHCNI
jgi:hypothetical protein